MGTSRDPPLCGDLSKFVKKISVQGPDPASTREEQRDTYFPVGMQRDGVGRPSGSGSSRPGWGRPGEAAAWGAERREVRLPPSRAFQGTAVAAARRVGWRKGRSRRIVGAGRHPPESGGRNKGGSMSGLKILLKSEDWMSLWVGLLLFILAMALLVGVDLLGWAVKTNLWLHPGQALGPVSKTFAAWPGWVSLVATFLFLAALMALAARGLGYKVRRFLAGFGVIFVVSYLCWFLGHFAYVGATADKLEALGIGWSLNLTGEAGYILALLVGLAVGNFFPGLAARISEATRPELYIKIAIVVMGLGLGVKAVEALGLASAVIFRGLCAIVEAYLIYWAVVYFIARKYFHFSKEWAAPLASGISICGVSAAIATGGAIRARPVVPIMVSSLVVIFAVVELVILPFAAQVFLSHEPMVAGAWMGLAVKTDGAAVAAGSITDALVRAKALADTGVAWEEGWILMATTTVKVFIDIFIGVWAFVLAILWVTVIDRREGERVRAGEIWDRFPKFVLGYVGTFLLTLLLCSAVPELLGAAKEAATEANVFRQLFFAMTFFTIGVVSNFRKLWEEGIGRLAAVYALCLFGFIIWVGLAISWIFFHGVTPPVAG